MKDIDIMELRVEALRSQLDTVNHKKQMLDELAEDILSELLTTRREILRASVENKQILLNFPSSVEESSNEPVDTRKNLRTSDLPVEDSSNPKT